MSLNFSSILARLDAIIAERTSKSFRRQGARPIPLNNQGVELLADRILAAFFAKHPPDDEIFGDEPIGTRFKQRVTPHFQVFNVQGNPVTVGIILNADWAKGNRKFVVSGGVEAGRVNGRLIPEELLITFNAERQQQDFHTHKGQFRKELVSVLRHEVTHLMDIMAALKTDADDRTYTHKPEHYYNDPREIKAFMRQVVDEVIEYAHKEGKEDPWNVLHFAGSFVEQALRASPTWERIEPHLNTQSEATIRKAVVRSLQDEWPELQRLYPFTE